MLKWIDCKVTFREIPDEICLCIGISNCPIKCKDCHSKYLWEDKGAALTIDELYRILNKNKGISVLCFMGGDAEPNYINYLAKAVKTADSYNNSPIKIAWYSGRDYIDTSIELEYFDFIKIGSYIKEKGGLDNPNTNQILYRIDKLEDKWILTDITKLFYENKN